MAIYVEGVCGMCDSKYSHDIRLSGTMFIPDRINALGYSVCSTRCAFTFTLNWIKTIIKKDEDVDTVIFKTHIAILNRRIQTLEHTVRNYKQSAILRNVRNLSVEDLQFVQRLIEKFKREGKDVS